MPNQHRGFKRRRQRMHHHRHHAISSDQDEASLQAPKQPPKQALSAGAASVVKLDGQGWDSSAALDTAWPKQPQTSPLTHGQVAFLHQIREQAPLLSHARGPLIAASVGLNLLATLSLAVVTPLALLRNQPVEKGDELQPIAGRRLRRCAAKREAGGITRPTQCHISPWRKRPGGSQPRMTSSKYREPTACMSYEQPVYFEWVES
ncbi:hypothetical protein V8E36_005415 [Tilletia maclaganii]